MANILRKLLIIAAIGSLSGTVQADPNPGKRAVLKNSSASEEQDSEQSGPALTKEAEAFYSGVTLSGGEPPPTAPPPPGFQNLTWTGFRMGEREADVFLQLTSQVSYQSKIKGRLVLVTLDKVKVPLRNNLRQVIAEHFPSSPVKRFRVRRLRRDKIRLEIRLRRKLVPNVSMRTFGQYSFLIVSFPVEAQESE